MKPHWSSTAPPALAIALFGALVITWPEQALGEDATYEVVEGDTLSELAERFRVTADQLRRWNELGSDVIRVGQRLVVGRNDDNTPEMQAYVVEIADTLGCIAARFGVSVEELRRWNEGLHPETIRAGQRLAIPADHEDRLATLDPVHVVRAGETLTAIADGFGVGVADIVGWNPGLDPDRIQPGQRLRVQVAQRRIHRVAEGEQVSTIARRYGVDVDSLQRWNPGLAPDRIRPGQRLVIRSVRPPTESVGAPTCGRLVNGRPLPPHPAYVIRHPERSYATDETIEYIVEAFDAVRRRHPDAPRVRVHDLSLPGGGAIDDHRSHQSGRDVDIVYYQRRCNGGICPLRPVLPRQLAIGPQWTLIEHWLRRGVAQRIYIDYGLQEVLYRYARRHGATRRELEAWFQYPRGRGADVGIVRHFPNHFDHVHVRFRCPEGDEECR